MEKNMKPTNVKTSKESNKPVFKARAGQVSGAVFSKDVEVNKKTITFYSTKISKSYKDDEDQWKETNSYNREDLIKVLLVTQKCAEFVYLQEDTDTE